MHGQSLQSEPKLTHSYHIPFKMRQESSTHPDYVVF